jgi:hypothetical protein
MRRICGHIYVCGSIAYDICEFLVIENIISSSFELPHSCLSRSSRHRKFNQLKYFKILRKIHYEKWNSNPIPLRCSPKAMPSHHILYLFKVKYELYILMFKIYIKILKFIKFNRIYKFDKNLQIYPYVIYTICDASSHIYSNPYFKTLTVAMHLHFNDNHLHAAPQFCSLKGPFLS